MIDALANLTFLRPAWLLLLVPAVLVWVAWRRRTDPLRGWRAQMDPELLDALVDGGAQSSRAARGGTTALLVAWIVGTLAAAGPSWRAAPSLFGDGARPLIVVLCAGDGMQLGPPADTALDRAQRELDDLVARLPGTPIGLVAYAGSAHLVVPPTRDSSVVAQLAREIAPDVMPVSGDRLDLALAEARRVASRGDGDDGDDGDDENGDGSGVGADVLVLADTIGAPKNALRASSGGPLRAIRVWALAPEDASRTDSLRAGADALDATVVAWTPDDADLDRVVALVSRDAHDTSPREGDDRSDDGYLLLPLVALAWLAAAAFSSGREGEA